MFISPGYKLLAALIAALLLVAGGAKVGYELAQGRNAAAALIAQQLADAQEKRLQALADDLTAARASREAGQVAKDRIITKEVIRYVQVTPPAARVVLPGAWRLQHDASATGIPAGDGSYLDGAADPIEDAAALETVADNYAACRADQRRLANLQEYWRLVVQR